MRESQKGRALMKRSLLILLLTFICVPAVFYCAGKAVVGNKNDVADWLPASYAETKQLGWFREHFVADQFIIISWDSCELGDKEQLEKKDDPRIEKLRTALLNVKHKNPDGTEFNCFKAVTTARRVLNELTAPPTELKYKDALERLKGSLVGPDGEQTCLIATLDDKSNRKLREVLGRPVTRKLYLRKRVTTPLFMALREAGITTEEVRLGGPPIDNVAIDEEGERTLLKLALLSGAFGLGLTWWSLRSLRMTLVVFTCGIISAVMSLAPVYLLGSSMDAILMSMPAMIYVLAVSGAIHYINYYREAINDGGFEGAVYRARRHAFGPALLCSTTTGIGLASLGLSDIVPIGKFGYFSAIAVFSMLLMLFIVLPAIMVVWPWHPPEISKDGKLKNEAEEKKSVSLVNQKGTWRRIALAIERRWGLVMAGSFATIIVLCLGLPQVKTSIDLLKLFQDDAQLLQDYRWFEANLGRLIPMELVLRFPASSRQEELPPSARPSQVAKTLTFLERLEMVGRLQGAIQERLGAKGEDLVGATMSAVTFAPDMGTQANGFMNNTYRFLVSDGMVDRRAQLERSGYLAMDKHSDDELWRISVRVAAFHDLDHGQLHKHIHEAVEPVMATQQASLVAVRSLVSQSNDLPTGSSVLIWSNKEQHDQAVDLATMLQRKRIKVTMLEKPFESPTEKQAEVLKKFDGVVLAGNVETSDRIQLIRAGVTVLGPLRTNYQEGADHTSVGSLVYTGVVPIVYKAQQALLDSLVESSAWSFVTITPLMMWVCRGVAAGAVAMLPNALPILVVFGGMGWLGFPVDIGSMMAASIALGVAVDDTIHYLAWFREDLEKLHDRKAATVAAYARCATPTLQAALVNGLGLSVFAVSSFTPTARFGWLMLTILVAGVIAELVMLPSLLFSPLGKAFDLPKEKKRWIPKLHWGSREKAATNGAAAAQPMVGQTVES
jgi:predicted RND superfamily exporter protein